MLSTDTTYQHLFLRNTALAELWDIEHSQHPFPSENPFAFLENTPSGGKTLKMDLNQAIPGYCAKTLFWLVFYDKLLYVRAPYTLGV
ncbi:MAG: hypothetical protein H6908_00015 [Hyphomicrobiales bacterium]|nr:hypothetical protein [Rickettsiales bacterium]MCP5361017.1 hypothetical protein [Hyphomicrobiales bacterium]